MKTEIKIGVIMLLTLCLLFVFSRFEVEFGRCLNDAGDGKLYNGEPFYNYINYGGHVDAHYDDIIMTISFNDLNDECMERWDFVIFKNTPSDFDAGNLEVVG